MDLVIADIGEALYEQVRRQSGETRAATSERLTAGEPVTEGLRRPTIFRVARVNLERGVPEEIVGEMMLAFNQARCQPPLTKNEVLGQVRGAASWKPPVDEAQLELEQEVAEFEADFVAGNVKSKPPPPVSRTTEKRRRALLRRAVSAINARAVEYLIENHVPLETLTLVGGVGGLGKSMLVLAWAAEVSIAGGNVLIVSYEDAAEQVIRPRFEALGGDLERLFEISIDPIEGSISFPIDLEELTRHALETEARMIVIDPVSASIDTKLDAHKDRDMRVVLGQLAKLAEKLHLAVVMIAHLNKAPGSDPYLRINGSTAFYNASRSVLTVTRDPEQDQHRFVAHHKSNYGMLAPVERWRLEIVEVPSAGGPLTVGRLVFMEVAEGVNREDVLTAPPTPEKRSEAEALVLVELAGGRRLSSEVKRAGVPKGISESTIKRAATALDVVVEEETTASGRVTFWSLPTNVGGQATPRPTADDPTPPVPHEHAVSGVGSGGSAHEADIGPDPTHTGCSHPDRWLARDDLWRCLNCDPPAFAGEVVKRNTNLKGTGR